MMIICGIAFSGLAAACVLVGLTIAMLAADVAASYRIYIGCPREAGMRD